MTPKLDKLEHKTAILKALERFGHDGHTIWSEEAWLATGLPAEWVRSVSQLHTSDGTLKGSICSNGQLLSELRGVYGLEALERMAQDLEASPAEACGRGFRASELTKNCLKILK